MYISCNNVKSLIHLEYDKEEKKEDKVYSVEQVWFARKKNQ